MEIKTLEDLSLQELTNLFNLAFADYFVKIELTPEILQEKINAEDVKLDKSVGIFSENKPFGFILHAVREINGEKIAYNAGTGVIPEMRGNSSTKKMYNYILPKLAESGISKVVLEVMEQNVAAIKSYLNIGFTKVLNLECFNGKIEKHFSTAEIEFKKTDNQQILKLKDFKSWQPSWQHDNLSVIQSCSYETVCGHLNNALVCYACIAPKTGRVAQFAVNPNFRRKGIGTALFIYLSEMCPDGLSLINLDGNQKETIDFLKYMGLNHFLRQFKMELKLK